jgi:hypothetical protein
MLKDKDKGVRCYTALNLGRIGDNAEKAIPHLVKMMRLGQKGRERYPNNCAIDALFRMGEKGKAFLSEEKIKELEESNRSLKDFWLDSPLNNKPKTIKPKTKTKPKEKPTTKIG